MNDFAKFKKTDAHSHHPSVEIQRVMSCGLSDAQLENVFFNNAAKLMRL